MKWSYLIASSSISFFKNKSVLNNKRILFITLVCFSLFWSTCDKTISGDFVENLPPSTNLTVEKIDRGGNFRLSSQIQISWFGSDPDGYIKGYEYAINDTSEGNFKFTTKTDSTFILPITPGQQTDDVLFKIRAVDNEDLRDPIGAKLVFPVVNSKPTVSINSNQAPPDTLYSVASFGWNFNDPDGFANIIRTEIAINDTVNGWNSIPFTEDDDGQLFVSLKVDNKSTGQKNAKVYLGRSFSTLQVDGQHLEIPVKVGEKNTFYVRTVDAAESKSEIDSTSWFIKTQKSKTLFLNDFSGARSQERQEFHLDLLQQNGITPDVWMINDGEVLRDKVPLSEAFPLVIDPTLLKTLAEWDHIYWISDDLNRNITYAQEILAEFFNNNGTVFVNIPMQNMDREDPLFNFLPVDSIASGQFFLFEDSLVVPQVQDISEVLKVKTGSFALFNDRPIKGVSGSKELYKTDYKRRTNSGFSEYSGYESVALENAEGNLVYFSLDITNLNGNSNLAEMIQEVVIDRLGFKQ